MHDGESELWERDGTCPGADAGAAVAQQLDGPRRARPDDLPGISRLVDEVFKVAPAGSLFKQYPQLFNADNCGNLVVFTSAGEVVSHVGMTIRWASILGCAVRAGCIGAVATAEANRRKGLASKLMDAAMRHARAGGVDFLLISGGLPLYRRMGAADVGRCWTGILGTEQTDETDEGRDISLAPPSAGDLDRCIAAYQAKPARFVRQREDWTWFLESQTCMNRPAALHILRRRGVFSGYLIVSKLEEADGRRRVLEYAGDAGSAAAGLVSGVRQFHAPLEVTLQQTDPALHACLERAGAAFKPCASHGTLLLVNPAQLLDRLRPCIAERAGQAIANALELRENGEELVFNCGEDRHATDRAGAAQAFFGHPEAGPLSGALGRALPVPALWYGLNYV